MASHGRTGHGKYGRLDCRDQEIHEAKPIFDFSRNGGFTVSTVMSLRPERRAHFRAAPKLSSCFSRLAI